MLRYRDKKGPLYAQIKAELLSKIERGTWEINAQLPPENELESQYGVSRGTVRRALSELEREGYITRMSGKGTFVTRVTPRIERPVGAIKGFTRQLSEAGLEPTSTVLRAQVIKAAEAGGRVKEGFGITSDAQVIHIERLRSGNNVPFSIQSVYLQPEHCPGILEADLSHLYRLYREKYDRWIVTADEILQVQRALATQAELLKVELGAPVVIRDRVSFDQFGEAFEVLHSVDRGNAYLYGYTIVTDTTELT